jgi:hypothetical protein
MIAPVNVIKNTATPMAAAKIYILNTIGLVDVVVLVVVRGANATAGNIGVVVDDVAVRPVAVVSVGMLVITAEVIVDAFVTVVVVVVVINGMGAVAVVVVGPIATGAVVVGVFVSGSGLTAVTPYVTA